ncbi:MAG: glycerophosphodiester phosphodiesterase family protein, partial [Anaerolineaceae bacterium]|nr:glycerophosphodiester phosphodiesterase family protein [Anaerolineaceae bacterium]
DAGQWFSPEFAGERIPTLGEVFEAVGDRLFINVELTNYASPRDPLPNQAADLVQRFRLEHRVLFSSFNPVNLLRIRSRLPNAQIALLALPGLPGLVARSIIGRLVSPRFIHPSQTEVTQAYIKIEHACKRKVNVWTVNDPAKMRQLFRWGVDGLFTDDPRSARQVLEQL